MAAAVVAAPLPAAAPAQADEDDSTRSQCLRIISEAISLSPEELRSDEKWKFLGLSGLLATAVASDLRREAGVSVPDDVFDLYPTVGSLTAFLHRTTCSTAIDARARTELDDSSDPIDSVPKSKVPLSVVVQGRVETAQTIVFLFPDGSGAGAAYASLPTVGKDVCIVALNSPFLRQAAAAAAAEKTWEIEQLATLWTREVLRIQPSSAQRPYVLGGWSAGGFYCFEAAKRLAAAGERVARLVLIDSPCRLRYGALPVEVVRELTRHGLMGGGGGGEGGGGGKTAPDWLVQHFTATVQAVDRYMPTPLEQSPTPESTTPQPLLVHFVWVRDGLVADVASSGLKVDIDDPVTRFLLEPRAELRAEGWDKLLPGAQYTYDYMTGNHFQITQAPHSHSLARILAKVLAS